MPKIVISEPPRVSGIEPPREHQTTLSPAQEKEYQAWLAVTGMQPGSAYDTRGLWLAKRTGHPDAATINPHDLPDRWKTPDHPTFSDRSQYAKPGQAPRWYGNTLVAPNGRVVADKAMPFTPGAQDSDVLTLIGNHRPIDAAPSAPSSVPPWPPESWEAAVKAQNDLNKRRAFLKADADWSNPAISGWGYNFGDEGGTPDMGGQ